MGLLEGRVALITGGGRGQGRNHAIRFAREGAKVAVCEIGRQIATVPYEMNRPGELEETVALVEKDGGECLAVEADVRDGGQMREAARQTIERFGRLDILCSNAGLWSDAPVEELTDEAWNDTIAVNLTGAFNSVRAVVPQMKAQKFGRIVMTSSTLAKRPVPNQCAYVAAKRGLLGMVDALAIELGRHGITVNAICPSVVKTGMALNPAFNRSFSSPVEPMLSEDAVSGILAGLTKLGVPRAEIEDPTNAALFLASDMARYVTGVAIDINPI